jgi:hypothetical protein
MAGSAPSTQSKNGDLEQKDTRLHTTAVVQEGQVLESCPGSGPSDYVGDSLGPQ